MTSNEGNSENVHLLSSVNGAPVNGDQSLIEDYPQSQQSSISDVFLQENSFYTESSDFQQSTEQGSNSLSLVDRQSSGDENLQQSVHINSALEENHSAVFLVMDDNPSEVEFGFLYNQMSQEYAAQLFQQCLTISRLNNNESIPGILCGDSLRDEQFCPLLKEIAEFEGSPYLQQRIPFGI